ncbi:MAG: alcohol dehydrogenase catalytic domain-containing protein [Verrucomicrobia bacterium]|nr:alcohol dehydrogenase catalytic domain-containing protein [Verrucomicrobiota bacterium]MBV8376258.1 alcohol dehydrogenase catalytic domain-containing protein [Verrucomicrobiota bacterium]
MKILQYNGPWQFSIEEVPTPSLGAEELLIHADAVGICGSDVHGFTGESGRRKPGMVMGHEAAGSVVSVGPKVASFQPGDRVAIYPTFGCGVCRHCLAGMEHICPNKRILGVNAGHWGAMADFFTCHQRQAFRLGAGVDPSIGLFAEPFAVALHAVNRMSPAKQDILAIVGAGTIGLALLVVLRDLGFETIFILDKIEAKLALARNLGGEAIHAGRDLPAPLIARQTAGRRANGVFEAVGLAQTARTAYDLCDFGGTVVLLGNLDKEFTLPLQGVTSNETTLRGSYGFNRAEFERAVDLVARKADVVRQLISGWCSLEETPGVMERLARGDLQAVKMVVGVKPGAESAGR